MDVVDVVFPTTFRHGIAGGIRGGGGSTPGRKAPGVGRYHESAPTLFLAACFRHILELAALHRIIIIIGTRPLLPLRPSAARRPEPKRSAINR